MALLAVGPGLAVVGLVAEFALDFGWGMVLDHVGLAAIGALAFVVWHTLV